MMKTIAAGTDDVRPNSRQPYRWVLGLVIAVIFYVASSGPVIATAFWMREATHWDGWYAVGFLYYPLLVWGHENNPFDSYIEFWVKLFGTVGPG